MWIRSSRFVATTLLANGFGEHNIQGIGDKHVPLIHNVMATDIVAAVSDRATDALLVLFNTPAGRAVLERRGVPAPVIDGLASFGLSSICNVLAAIKTARQQHLGAGDVIVTVATDGAEMYATGIERIVARDHPDGFGAADAAAVRAEHLDGVTTDHMLECTRADRDRIFNLGYFTWVEQQGIPLDEFEARRSPDFWSGLRAMADVWDELIDAFNAEVGAVVAA